MSFVNKGIRKKDAMSLVTGKPVYTDDIAPSNCLIVKVLRSPHAHALVEDINIEIANKVPGIECILTYKDVPKSRFTMAGQSYPEPSPYDRLILDKRIRCVGDPVAIVAGIDNKCVDKALKLIKVKYEVLDAILDFREAKDNKILVHPEEDFKALCDVGVDAKRNLCSCGELEIGNVEEELSKCDYIIEQTYHTKANSQAMMETFRTFTELDTYGRLNITSSTQIPFHVRRILSNALEIPKSKIRVIKPRIGGGFGAKQSVVAEVFPAIVTLKTGKPAKMIFTRKESMTNGSPRHEMEIKVRLGADKNGVIKAIDVYTLSNAGAYGEHGPTTVGLSGHKSMPLYGTANAYRFNFDVVYSNTMGGGAYRGYGATQGIFALESAVNELAAKLNMDPIKIREINMVREGQVMPAYYNETANSCALDKCLEKAKEMIEWDKKYPCRDMGNGKVRSVGVAMAMQGSGISNVDTAAVEIKLNDDGFYTLMIGASEMGMGCDTILAQMAADCLDCDIDNIIVHGVDTDQSPYDTGSYASSTTYITGGAVVKTCETLRKKIIEESSKLLNCLAENLDFDGEKIFSLEDNKSITLKELANATYIAGSSMLSASESNSSPISPPPFMVGIVETEIDKLTGKLEIIDYVAVVDCGTVINPNLARIQTEGGIAQGVGMALYEDITYDKNGRMRNDSFLQYKIPTRLDVGNIRVEFESSYEPTGPFGAKSIGEIVINTPSPALANAVYNATKVNIRTLPITAEKIAMGMLEK
ncbi:molybdopterin cofactor-binding domain-containing protein [Clostridium sp. BL-8]|uniref:xanthine dehydrogenase family protein molybdopterin-binding subunit n=1 Tax=Clostridium sp. BL-8 TaxID=349938 RepID=UPI00098CA994|nr:molybdopterin cofactor-binding domain-containing protein [Clostridium sp. BL-8]OOM81077.1 xanthine dehydrogenase molybdenum-binding subunit [Clostridium sp. BL-8]